LIVSLTNFYELLDVAPAASQDEVKQAFRLQIARYHPDKVQHLGKEFREMASRRAADLTQAYRVLSDKAHRAEYDLVLANASPTLASETPMSQPQAVDVSAAPSPGPSTTESEGANGPQFFQERLSRDEFVRTATISRFRHALARADPDYDEAKARGFDTAWVPKPKLFTRGKGPRLLGQCVSRVDGAAVAEAWMRAGKWSEGNPANDEICVFLMGSSMAPAGELAKAIAEQRRRARGRRITLIPIDARNWDAHVPTDAPTVAKNLLAKLREEK
jgi:curved DNA-binding protein CbpA